MRTTTPPVVDRAAAAAHVVITGAGGVGGAVIAAVALSLSLGASACGQGIDTYFDLRDEEEFDDVGALTLEDLMDIEVTIVEGTAASWFESPAAVWVITGEDIRRSGALSLPEALRLAPGIFVGQTSSHAYSVGMRGFNGSLANKTLILIDGRSVYDPLFGGTYWNVQDVLLEDLERIEVIRGPGPTLWGANAVNGVVNIITKSAAETQGLYVSGGVGNQELGFGMVRYGAALSDSSWFRVYGKWFERDTMDDPQLGSGHDDWNMFRGGFRFDAQSDEDLYLTIQGDAYHSGRIGESFTNIPVIGEHLMFFNDTRDARSTGGNLLFRLTQEIDAQRQWSLQGYYDRTERTTNAGFRVHRDTFDLSFRHQFPLGEVHEILWGVEGRSTSDRTRNGPNTFFDPGSTTLTRYGIFVQDTITLVPDKLFGMIGTKLSDSTYGGTQWQPSARLWWTPNNRHTLWAAVSRPVRVPSRLEHDGSIAISFVDTGLIAGGPATGDIVPISIDGSDDLEPETMLAYELGYRVRPTDRLMIDTAVFYNDYDRLIYLPATIIGAFNNDGYAETYGVEVAARWTVADNWRIDASYSFVDVQIHGPIFTLDEANTPHHQAQLLSYLNLTDELELNGAMYYVDALSELGIRDYLRLDLGLTWRPTDHWELSVWGLNLLDPEHPEFSSREVERSAYVRATYRF